MKIRTVRHKGLRRLIEDDDVSGFQPSIAGKLRVMIAFPAGYGQRGRAPRRSDLEGAQARRRPQGAWALHVTRNWRLTFEIDRVEIEILDLDYVDYH